MVLIFFTLNNFQETSKDELVFNLTEGLVLSGDTWNSMLEAEKDRAKKLELKLAATMTENKVFNNKSLSIAAFMYHSNPMN